MKRERSARIIATLGPSSSSRECIRALVGAGADVFGLNFSHGKHADHAGNVQRRQAQAKKNRGTSRFFNA